MSLLGNLSSANFISTNRHPAPLDPLKDDDDTFQSRTLEPSRPTNLPPTAVDAPPNPHINSPPPLQPGFANKPTIAAPEAAIAATRRRQPGTGRNSPASRRRGPNNHTLPPPFRNRAAGSNPPNRIPRRIGGPGRLWNPTNSTPRVPPTQSVRPARQSRKRRPSTPPPPSVPLVHPTINISSDPNDPISTSAGRYPLLTLPEQIQNRHSAPIRASLQIEGRESGDTRISLPSSVRHSYDVKRASDSPPKWGEAEAKPSEPKSKDDNPLVDALRKRGQSVTKRARAISFGLVRPDSSASTPKKVDKGKGKAVMLPTSDEDPSSGFTQDLERGPDVLGRQRNASNLSLPDGISAVSSNSSIMGDPDQPDTGEEWGPQHPCFPHINPHVPINSQEYTTTRIIRVRRDWLIEGDLAPTFSNLYPEILDPAGVSEQEFRRIIEKINGELVATFNPYYWRNILDGVLGLVTGWIWDDMGLTNAKIRLRSLESWIEKWNAEMEKTVGSEEGTTAPRIVPLRRTGYMNLDIQIPDPEVSISNSEPASRSGPHLPAEPGPATLGEPHTVP
ncbi:Uu.00g059700.m01.CDS01 [Anthostomella pinea]|uniref:Ras modification protein ERF4 n=1 Tax=Anthostomella pinea TaxID=933095 RepID=A0AAI8YMI1_9PEZI|nr:Uu.00g059700.m01.CDS01 [Anthostomella pinea]